jgi:hypothetical protein
MVFLPCSLLTLKEFPEPTLGNVYFTKTKEMNKDETLRQLAQLWNAIDDKEDELTQQIRGQLQQNWSDEQIDFLLEQQGKLAAQRERSTERTNRAQAIWVSIAASLPTIFGGIAFKWLTLTQSYIVTSEIERWFGGIVVGSLFSLAVFDYGNWCNQKFSQQGEVREAYAWRALRVWSALDWKTKARIVIKPQSLTRLVEIEIEESVVRVNNNLRDVSIFTKLPLLTIALESLKVEVPPTPSKARRLQGHLLLRFSERGWRDYWRSVRFEKELAPTRFFFVISVLCGCLAALDSVTGGGLVSIAIFVLLSSFLPMVSVATIYLPSLLGGVEPAQSANLAAAVRVLMTMFVLSGCVLVDLYLHSLGLIDIGLIDIMKGFF